MKKTSEHILKDFDDVMHQLIAELSSLNEKELNTLPDGNSWTPGQLGDHLYRSYQVADILNGTVETTERDPEQKLAEVEKTFLDFSMKMESPEEILPAIGKIEKDRLIRGLKERIEQQREVILKKDLTKTCLDLAIPEYGYFTRLEWLGFNIVHTKRHLRQLRNIISRLKGNDERKKEPSAAGGVSQPNLNRL